MSKARWSVQWTHSADLDFGRAIGFIETESAQVADRFVRRILSRVRQLGDNPRLGTKYVVDAEGREFRRLVVREYVVYYWLAEDERTVWVARVWHGRRNPADLVLD